MVAVRICFLRSRGRIYMGVDGRMGITMTDKIQISMRLDRNLVEKADQMRDGIDRSLIITKLLEGWTQGKFKIELFK